jgi:hypothetical protein
MEEGIQIRLIQPGEWLFEVRLAGKIAALFPVYVGIAAPEDPLLEPPSGSIPDEVTAIELLSQKLAQVRDAYGLLPWTSNILLDKAANTGLKLGTSSERSATAVGYANSQRLACEAITIEDCLDSMIWDPGLRGVLLSDAPGELGIAAKVSVQSLRFELLVNLQTL